MGSTKYIYYTVHINIGDWLQYLAIIKASKITFYKIKRFHWIHRLDRQLYLTSFETTQQLGRDKVSFYFTDHILPIGKFGSKPFPKTISTDRKVQVVTESGVTVQTVPIETPIYDYVFAKLDLEKHTVKKKGIIPAISTLPMDKIIMIGVFVLVVISYLAR